MVLEFINAVLRRVFDALMSPLAVWHELVGLTLISAILAVAMLLVFKHTSDQLAIDAVKRRIHASLFEICNQVQVQELVAKPAVEALGEAILPRCPWLDEQEPTSSRKSRRILAMNSGPLSDLTTLGTPRALITCVKNSRSSAAGRFRFASRSKHSRVYSSTSTNHLISRPASSRLKRKSQAQTSLGCAAGRRLMPPSLDPMNLRFRAFLGTLKPSRFQRR